ncbi:MAG: lipopolysaccharide biosynthesis protein, partial [Brevundimonas sp.]|nr:lipopolysaccharide biosynthesis protein [Brevundimonas sp.]
QQAEDEARLGTARAQLAAGSTGEDVGEALNSTVVQQLRNRRAEVSGRIAEMSSRYGPRHPAMLSAQGELSDIDTQIRAEIGRIISNLEARAQVSSERTASMSASLAGARRALIANNTAGVRLNELVRNAEASRTLYQGLLDRFKQTSTQAGLEQSDARVVSRAAVPAAPSSPSLSVNLAVGLALALAAAAAAIVIADLLDTGLSTADDIERRLGLPHIGSVPLVASIASRADRHISPADYLVEKPMSAFAEAMRSLRASIAFAQLGQAAKLIVVASSLPGEGKTTTAVTLARSAALAGQKVIVVDCDLRRHAVNQQLGLEPKAGLLEVLSGQATLEDAVMTDQASGASVLALVHADFMPRDVFQSQAMEDLLQTLKQAFDLVILDTAPVLAVSETRFLAARADAVVFLARWRTTPEKAIDEALRLLEQSGAPVAGIALVQVDMKAQARYGYGDSAHYYGAYKTYYVG